MQIKLLELNPVHVNTYLIYDETREAALIDCGASTSNEKEKIRKYISFYNLELKLLLNTHLHFDHILGNRYIYDTYGLLPQYHEKEETMPSLQEQASFFGIQVDYESIHAKHFIRENDELHFGYITLKALLTPGHSQGSLSFYCETEQCVFTGDTLFRHNIGRTDLWSGNESVLLSSIQQKLLSLPDNTRIYPGHGLTSTIAEEKRNNLYF